MFYNNHQSGRCSLRYHIWVDSLSPNAHQWKQSVSKICSEDERNRNFSQFCQLIAVSKVKDRTILFLRKLFKKQKTCPAIVRFVRLFAIWSVERSHFWDSEGDLGVNVQEFQFRKFNQRAFFCYEDYHIYGWRFHYHKGSRGRRNVFHHRGLSIYHWRPRNCL